MMSFKRLGCLLLALMMLVTVLTSCELDLNIGDLTANVGGENGSTSGDTNGDTNGGAEDADPAKGVAKAMYEKAVDYGYGGTYEQFVALVDGDPDQMISNVTEAGGVLLLVLTDGTVIDLIASSDQMSSSDRVETTTPSNGMRPDHSADPGYGKDHTEVTEPGENTEKEESGKDPTNGDHGATVAPIPPSTDQDLSDPGDSGNPNVSDVPDLNYGGKTYTLFLPDENNEKYFDVKSVNGEGVNDATYHWLRNVEKKYGVTIKLSDGNTSADQHFQAVNAHTMAGSTNYNIYGSYANRVGEYIAAGLAGDWNSLGSLKSGDGKPMINLNASRWDSKLNGAVTHNEKLFALSGNLGASKLMNTTATFVNLDLLTEYVGESMDDLYGLVENGAWTYAEFSRRAKMIHTDLNANGRDGEDVFGYFVTDKQTDSLYAAFGRSLLSYDTESGAFGATFMDDPTNNSILAELRSFYWGSDAIWTQDASADATEKFRAGELGFLIAPLSDLYESAGFDRIFEFGILPNPKWDTDQSDYYNKMDDSYTVWCLPCDLANAEKAFTAHVTDVLCAVCTEMVYPAYYKTFAHQYSGIHENERMFELVMSSPCYDTAMQFSSSLGEYCYLPRTLIMNPDLSATTTYSMMDKKIERILYTLNGFYAD